MKLRSALPAPGLPDADVPAAAAPFTVERLRLAEKGGHFTPAARLLIAPGALREGGLLARLPDEAARTLLAMLACVTAHGRVQPDTHELAALLGVPEREARERLRRLAALPWRGGPLAHEIASQTGRVSGVLSRHAVTVRDATDATDPPDLPDAPTAPRAPGETVDLPLPPAGTSAGTYAADPALTPSRREKVIAHSRAEYGRPRAEVERLVAEQLSHGKEDDGTPEGTARRKLRGYGISAPEAERLVSSYPLERIERQVGWMGMRQARDPARFLAAAIRGDYAPPEYVRRQSEQEERERQTEAERVAVDNAG